MILSDSEILKYVKNGEIVITPFDPECLGSNSYDVHLGRNLSCYKNTLLESAKPNEIGELQIPEEGLILQPRTLYLGVTQEYTETHNFVPNIDGKSSVGRLGIGVHVTAGRGDVGFCGHFTLEIWVVKPVRVYAGMPIGQLTYNAVMGSVQNPYNSKPTAKYNNGYSLDPKPTESMLFKNTFFQNK